MAFVITDDDEDDFPPHGAHAARGRGAGGGGGGASADPYNFALDDDDDGSNRAPPTYGARSSSAQPSAWGQSAGTSTGWADRGASRPSTAGSASTLVGGGGKRGTAMGTSAATGRAAPAADKASAATMQAASLAAKYRERLSNMSSAAGTRSAAATAAVALPRGTPSSSTKNAGTSNQGRMSSAAHRADESDDSWDDSELLESHAADESGATSAPPSGVRGGGSSFRTGPRGTERAAVPVNRSAALHRAVVGQVLSAASSPTTSGVVGFGAAPPASARPSTVSVPSVPAPHSAARPPPFSVEDSIDSSDMPAEVADESAAFGDEDHVPTVAAAQAGGEVRTYHVGDVVQVRYRRGPDWYPGRIKDVHTDGTYEVVYDDEDTEDGVRPAYMTLVHAVNQPPSTSAPAALRAAGASHNTLREGSDGTGSASHPQPVRASGGGGMVVQLAPDDSIADLGASAYSYTYEEDADESGAAVGLAATGQLAPARSAYAPIVEDDEIVEETSEDDEDDDATDAVAAVRAAAAAAAASCVQQRNASLSGGSGNERAPPQGNDLRSPVSMYAEDEYEMSDFNSLSHSAVTKQAHLTTAVPLAPAASMATRASGTSGVASSVAAPTAAPRATAALAFNVTDDEEASYSDNFEETVLSARSPRPEQSMPPARRPSSHASVPLAANSSKGAGSGLVSARGGSSDAPQAVHRHATLRNRADAATQTDDVGAPAAVSGGSWAAAYPPPWPPAPYPGMMPPPPGYPAYGMGWGGSMSGMVSPQPPSWMSPATMYGVPGAGRWPPVGPPLPGTWPPPSAWPSVGGAPWSLMAPPNPGFSLGYDAFSAANMYGASPWSATAPFAAMDGRLCAASLGATLTQNAAADAAYAKTLAAALGGNMYGCEGSHFSDATASGTPHLAGTGRADAAVGPELNAGAAVATESGAVSRQSSVYDAEAGNRLVGGEASETGASWTGADAAGGAAPYPLGAAAAAAVGLGMSVPPSVLANPSVAKALAHYQAVLASSDALFERQLAALRENLGRARLPYAADAVASPGAATASGGTSRQLPFAAPPPVLPPAHPQRGPAAAAAMPPET
ncbi:MAG: hypothetical protein EOO41_00545, partial [Methanobacteriota archaeon]